MNPSPSVKHSTGHIVSETKNNMGDKKINDKNRRQRNHSWTMSKSIVSVDKESENSSWICLPNEEYVVFCIKEDGAYDVMIESNKSEESNQSEKSSWLVNRKDAERDELSSDEGRSNEDGSEGEANATKEQFWFNGERGTTCCEVELASISLKRLEESRDSYLFDGSTGLASGSLRRLEESRDSYESDGSTGPFTFPWDWIGSPVRMPLPTSEGITPSKNKAHCVPKPRNWIGSPVRMPLPTSEGTTPSKNKAHCVPKPRKKGIGARKKKTHFMFFQCFKF
ncbi:hypothetical protein ERO13_A09G243850v2 [Gossypium hirsutum]|nr:hypothetical protein ERO13_A09G243850v2 [Gossypium hirsutum]